MDIPSPFRDDWHDAQEAHFQYISRVGDAHQRAAARAAMAQAGYSEEEIAQLYVAATMHQDDLPDGFVADVEVIEQLREKPHPNDCTCPSCRR